MQRLILFSFILVQFALNATSQWTNDPNNPQVVCNSVNTQSKVQQIPDGSGGTFVFWLDGRTDYYNLDVYGQHYDQDGIEQWENSGRMILNYSGTITRYRVLRSQAGEIIIGWLTNNNANQDTLRFQKLNSQGAKLWGSDLFAARSALCQLPIYSLGISGFNLMEDNSGFVVSMETVYCGGANGNRVTRFDSYGNLTGSFNGEPEGTQFYMGSPGLDRTYDMSNDVFVFYSNGNGGGAHASCLRVSLDGDTIWGPIDVLAGTNGLSYQFRGISDASGIAFCFQSFNANSGSIDLFIRKYGNDGSLLWTHTLCEQQGDQGNFDWREKDGNYYISWSDGRPGVIGYSAIYAQKVDGSGTAMWTTDGVQVFNQNTYIPYSKFILTPDDEMIIINEASVAPYFNAMLVNPDGTNGWAQPVGLGNYGLGPFYDDYQIIRSGTNTIVAWAKSYSGGGADDIDISRFFSLPPSCPEDLNNDGVVNTSDLLLFMGGFGCMSGCGDPDLNSDGVVNTSDLLLFMGAFGTICP